MNWNSELNLNRFLLCYVSNYVSLKCSVGVRISIRKSHKILRYICMRVNLGRFYPVFVLFSSTFPMRTGLLQLDDQMYTSLAMASFTVCG